MTDDSPRNPEADTFQYIQLVIESLNKMSRLDIALDTIEQRLPVELFKVVEKSNNEVAQRHPSVLRAYASKKGPKAKTGLDSDDLRTRLLNDLLWTLYARFEAIAESHRAVHDVVVGIVRREKIGDSTSTTLTRGFKELWKLYQSEVSASNRICSRILTYFSRSALYYTTTWQPMAISHTEAARARHPAEVSSHACLETRTSACSSSPTWIPSRQSSLRSVKT
jgi:hypothetical protein